ncbi:MAG: hypothetical protein ACK5KT_03525 [Dysgonomonas sp.]
MGLKKKILLGFLIAYWGTIGIGLFTVSGFGSIPFLVGGIVIISLALLLLVKNKYLNIIGACGLYLSSIFILIGVLLITIFFSRSNEPIYCLLLLFSISNFIITHFTSKLCGSKELSQD